MLQIPSDSSEEGREEDEEEPVELPAGTDKPVEPAGPVLLDELGGLAIVSDRLLESVSPVDSLGIDEPVELDGSVGELVESMISSTPVEPFALVISSTCIKRRPEVENDDVE